MRESGQGSIARLLQACVLGAGLAAGAAQAVVVSGRFEGTMAGATWGQPFEGVPIAGAFSFDLDEVELNPEAGPGVWNSGAGSWLTVDLFYPWGTGQIRERAGFMLQLAERNAGLLLDAWDGGFLRVGLHIASADGAPWAAAGDLRRLRPGPIDVAASSFDLSDNRVYGRGSLTALQLQTTPAAPVPEPQTLLLMLAGAAALAVRVRRAHPESRP